MHGSVAHARRGQPAAWAAHAGAALTALLALLALAATGPAAAAARYDFLVFPAVIWQDDDTGPPPGYALQSERGGGSAVTATLNLFTTVESERFRFLGEWFFTEHGNEIQRLQLGWRSGERDTLWFGRYHTPTGYWNTAFHHGTYLQTSISRPGIEAFEGGHGPLPTHFTGLLWEGYAGDSGGAVHYSVAAGAGPRLEQRLDPLDVAHPEGGHGEGLIVNVSWRPAPYDPRQVGAFAGRTRIPDVHGHDSFEQDMIGAYAHWNWHELRLTGALFHVAGRFRGETGRERFSNGYLQAEWPLGERWTPYARLETTQGAHADDAYIGRFSGFVTERALAGLRFELSPRQALTVEVSSFDTLGGRGERVAVQWSAYFP